MQEYFNSTNQNQKTVDAREKTNKNQNELVAQIFREHPKKMTPFEVCELFEKYYQKTVPITSIRRAITRLTEACILSKLNSRKQGNYGRENYTWIINTHQTQLNIF
jgi:hypothetical protein